MTEIRGPRLLLRPWRPGDEAALVRHGNDRGVWRNLTDRFPHPYTTADATEWIEFVVEQGTPPRNFAICFEGEPIGGVGVEPGGDLHTRTAEVGYWVGRAFWGRGIATEAARLIVDYAFANFPLERLEAGVLAWNPRSTRVLEKAGFTFETRQPRRVFKDGEVTDELLYRLLRPEPETGEKTQARPDAADEGAG